MSDYDEENLSEKSDESVDYADDISESGESVNEIVLTTKYNELLIEKSKLISDFNNGNIAISEYFIEMSKLNNQLNETEFDRQIYEQNIMEKEIKLNELLNAYEQRIREEIKNYPEYIGEKRGALTDKEYTEMKNIRNELERLYASYDVIEEDNEPLESNKLFEEWKNMAEEQKNNLEKLSGMIYPRRTDFKNNAEYNKAQEEYLENINIFFESYWESFEAKEEKELLTLAKNMKLKKPISDSDLSYLRQFVSKGYIPTMSIRKLGGDPYEKVDKPSLPERINKLIKEQNEPLQLTPEQQIYTNKIKNYNSLLGKLDKEQLKSCILQTGLFKPPSALSMKQDKPKQKQIIFRATARKNIEKILGDKYKAYLLEEYIYKITKVPEPYYSKVKDILFIFNHYPDFKTKFLQGQVNIYQLVLFENVLFTNNILVTYPTTVKNRKESIQKIIKELFISTFDRNRPHINQILTKIRIKKKSKELERFIFDLAQNQRDYLFKIKQMVLFIRKNGYLVFKPEFALEFLNPKVTEIKSENFNITLELLTFQEVKIMLLQEQYKLQELEKKKQLLQAKNFVGTNVLFWELPSIIPQEQHRKWNNLRNKAKQAIMTSDYQGFIDELNKLHFYYIKQYKLDFIPGLPEITAKISEIEKKINDLQKVFFKKQSQELDIQRKLTAPIPIQVSMEIKSNNYPKINEILIGQVVQAIKRSILNLNVNLLELYDINELNNKTTVVYEGKQVRVITLDTYNKIKDFLINEMKVPNFILINRKAMEQAIQQIANITGISIEQITTADAAIKELTSKWKPQWNGEKILDVYGENVFEKLLNSNDPFKFYKVIREYNELVDKFTPQKQQIYIRPQARLRGDTQWYNVEYLDKDTSTGQPLTQIKEEMVRNPRTKLLEKVNKVTVRRGKVPFIKRTLKTEQIGVDREIWTEVSQNQIEYRTPNLNFGKSRIKIDLKPAIGGKYKLNDPTNKRHQQIHKRILAEKKLKGGSLRKGAIAFKRRLVVLRTYRKSKNKSKYYKILNSDINYINKNYLN